MATVLTDKVVNTRKSHQCWGCGHLYERGEQMRYNTYADEGSVYSAYWCRTCDHILQNHYDSLDLEDGIEFGSVKENDNNLWESTNLENTTSPKNLDTNL